MLAAFLVPLFLAALPPPPQLPEWAMRCAQTHALRTPDVLGSLKGDLIVGSAEIVVRRYDPAHRVLTGVPSETGRLLTFALEPRTTIDVGVDPIRAGDTAMLRLIFEAPCLVHVDAVEVNLWVSDARVLETVPGGFSFEKLEYHTGVVDRRLASEDGFVVPQVAVPLPNAAIDTNGSDDGSLGELVPGTRVKIYGRKSPHSKVVRFFRIEKF